MRTGIQDRLAAPQRSWVAPDTGPMTGFNQQSALHDSGEAQFVLGCCPRRLRCTSTTSHP